MKNKKSKNTKKAQALTGWQKIGLTTLIIGTLIFVRLSFFPDVNKTLDYSSVPENQVKFVEDSNKNVQKSYVSVYFIGQNSNKDEVYKIIKRPYNSEQDGTKLSSSIKSLLQGPTKFEQARGIYSEIPLGTKLLSLKETPDKVIINLNDNFEQGGGTDGLYKRLYQLIKTVNKNTTLNVYLYIDGKRADVVGGEGIMLNQPLNKKSLDE